MSRLQLALNVTDIDQAIAFYAEDTAAPGCCGTDASQAGESATSTAQCC